MELRPAVDPIEQKIFKTYRSNLYSAGCSVTSHCRGKQLIKMIL